MKIDLCLIAADNNPIFTDPWKLVYKMWRDVCNIEAKLVLIADKIPDNLKDIEDTIILFKPIENMHTAFQSQCIRILYPCLFDNKNIIVSDADIIPVRKEYFVDSIKNINDNKFITYRDAYLKQKMYGLCYCAANSNVWKDIFKINDEDDLRNTLIEWYDDSYDGKKNCTGWFTDQKKIYYHLSIWEDKDNHIKLKDKDLNFKRLDKRQRNFIASVDNELVKNLENKQYTDFHFIRPYKRFNRSINKICDKILEYK